MREIVIATLSVKPLTCVDSDQGGLPILSFPTPPIASYPIFPKYVSPPPQKKYIIPNLQLQDASIGFYFLVDEAGSHH